MDDDWREFLREAMDMVPVCFVCSLHGSYFSSLLALHLFFLRRHVKIAVSPWTDVYSIVNLRISRDSYQNYLTVHTESGKSR